MEMLLEELEDELGSSPKNVYRCCLWGYCAAYRMYTGRAHYPLTGSDFAYLLRRGGLLMIDEEDHPVFLRDILAEKDPLFVDWMMTQQQTEEKK